MEKIKTFIKKAWQSFDWLPDKVKHIIVCAVGSTVFTAGFGIGAGLAAEYKDKAWGGAWSWGDIIADAIGTAAGGIVNFLIIREIWLS